MKVTELKDRLNETFENVFQRSPNENYEIEINRSSENSSSDEEKKDNKKLRKALKVLRQVLLFLPATFITFYIWMGMTIFGLPTVDRTLFISVLIISPVLMVLGLGNIKNIKHWISPLSVIILGVLIGIIPNLLPFSRSFFTRFENVVMLFPLALIIAVLSKNWVDGLTKQDID